MTETFTRKLGPLPVWAWVGVLVAAYFLYRRLHPSTPTSSSTGSTGTAPTDQTTYVPPFDAASMSGGGGIGSTGVPSTVNNYYYGDQAAQQSMGGGTSPGQPVGVNPTTPQRRVDVIVPPNIPVSRASGGFTPSPVPAGPGLRAL